MHKKIFEIGSEYDWDSNIPFLKDEKNDFYNSISKQNVLFLRSGRDAIRYVARVCKNTHKTVLMPSLMCSCVPQQFEEEGYRVVYYKVNSDFTADIDDIKKKIKHNDILFFMNYFGQKFIEEEQLQKLKDENEDVILVEDITHDFLKRRTEQFKWDYTVCSIRKWFAIPDGGMVIGREQLQMIEIENNNHFAKLRESAMKQKNSYFSTGITEEKDKFRNMLAESNDYIDNIDNVAGMQDISKNIVFSIDLKSMYEDRKKNVMKLHDEIKNIEGIKPLVEKPEESTLYYPIIVEESQSKLQSYMAMKSVYMPVIWPVPEEAIGICKVADETADKMLAIPCDHRYSEQNMGTVLEELKNNLNK